MRYEIFSGDLDPFLLQFHLQSLQTLMASGRDLALMFWTEGVFLIWEWRAGHSRKATFWPNAMVLSPAEKSKGRFSKGACAQATMHKQLSLLNRLLLTQFHPLINKRRDFYPTHSRLLRPSLKRHIFSSRRLGSFTPFLDRILPFWVLNLCSTSNSFSSLKTSIAFNTNRVFV